MNKTHFDSRERGFTLMEVLLAVAILGVSLVTIVALQIKTIRVQQVANRTTVATLLAQEILTMKMQEISETESPSVYFDEGDFEEDYEEEYEEYRWEYTLTTMPEADDLYQIDLTVYWDEEDKKSSSVALTSLLYVEP